MDRKPTVPGSGQHEQIVGEPREMSVLVRGAEDRRGQLLDGLGAGERELEVHPLHGERRPHLVARPVDEPSLAGDGVVDAPEHAVEGPAQPRDLVVRRRLRESRRRIGGRDRGRLPSQAHRKSSFASRGPNVSPPSCGPRRSARTRCVPAPVISSCHATA